MRELPLSRIRLRTSVHLDHIIAEKHGGPTISVNLAWAFAQRTEYRWPRSLYWGTDTTIYPRTDQWADHFEWDGVSLRGKTPIGRTTVAVLAPNVADSIAVRQALRDEGLFKT
jgi:hypothetical protein